MIEKQSTNNKRARTSQYGNGIEKSNLSFIPYTIESKEKLDNNDSE